MSRKAEKLPSGSYRVRVYNKYTKKQVSFTAPTPKEARAMADEYERSMDSSTSTYTVKDALEHYISNRSAVLSPSTIKGYRRLQRTYYTDLEPLSVDRIMSEDIQRFINDLAIDLSPKTVRNISGLLISSIRAIRPNKTINVSLPQKKPVQRNIPTDRDIKALIDSSHGNLRKAILLASAGTLRRGEISALKFSDIKGNTIHVHADMVLDDNNKWIYKDVPKNTSSDRYIDFPKEIIEELGNGSGFIVTAHPDCISHQFIRLRKKLGLQCRFHDLRHYAASIMHAIGIPDQYIQARGGWSSPSMLHEVYRNTLDDKNREFADITNDYMARFLKN